MIVIPLYGLKIVLSTALSMSDAIKHECGIVLLRLLKPLHYYYEKYGSSLYGLKKLYLLMEKQHNRGQDGAGVASIKLDPQPGFRYINRQRSIARNPIEEIFQHINEPFAGLTEEQRHDMDYLKREIPFAGELLMGHLRYGTFGINSIAQCHPFVRDNNWMSRNLVLAGNFNMTNVDEMFRQLEELGQHPKESTDNVTMLEKIGHFLDEENQEIFDSLKKQGLSNQEISRNIAANLDVAKVLRRAFARVDGGYAMVGMIGHGDAFVIRDPAGIRPAFYYHDDEIALVTSERPAIQTAFNVPLESIKEITPGHALIIRKNGRISEELILEPEAKQSCTFERIYFSRGNDADIYRERKKLGFLISDMVLQKVNYDLQNTVYSYIPNTAATSFYGMIDGIHQYIFRWQQEEILKLGTSLTPEKLKEIIEFRPRREKIALKDVKVRTFIADDSHREDMVAHVYDVTYGVVEPTDTLVVIDDSIVRGSTLKLSILRILDRLGPKKIIVVSSAPQIRYPDCYGIDMSRLGEFVAFQALLRLLDKTGQKDQLKVVYEKAKAELQKPVTEMQNVVKELYDLFDTEEITKEITAIITPEDIKADVELVYQSIENLHLACPDHHGDWYFSGNYPTPGGNKVVNRSFVNFFEGNNLRAY